MGRPRPRGGGEDRQGFPVSVGRRDGSAPPGGSRPQLRVARRADRLLYSAGAALAMPGGLLGARFGDRAAVLTALGLMTLGGGVMNVGASWPMIAGGRLVSRAGRGAPQ